MNETEQSVLICQLVLAHFVTLDVAPIAFGNEREIGFRRDLDEGTIVYQRAGGGKIMALENVLCGRAEDWRESRQDLDLAVLRQGRARTLRILCGDKDGMVCRSLADAQ